MRCWVGLDSCGPAAYLWTSAASGNELRLCEDCCAAWRLTAVDEPDLAPSRITLLAATEGAAR